MSVIRLLAPVARAARIGALMLLVSVGLAACGGGGKGGGAAANLPKPPAGKATVGGEVIKDGQSLANEDISLSVGGKTRAKTKTDATGRFVFQSVDPESYRVGFGLTLKAADVGAGGKCSVPGYTGLVIHLTSRTGERIAIASLQSKPFKVQSGDRVVKDINVTCRTK